MTFWNTILEAVFPSRCLGCKAPGIDLCRKCLASFPEPERENKNWVFSLFDYRHPGVKKTIWLLKYKSKKRLAEVLGEILYEKILVELADLVQFENFQNPLLIPIPLSRERYRSRGFNQSEILCEKIFMFDTNQNLRIENKVLVKTRSTEQQAHIKNRKERLENLSGSFMVKNKEKIKGRNLILIDDVTTTGATLEEARKVLRSSGARKIIAFTVAH